MESEIVDLTNIKKKEEKDKWISESGIIMVDILDEVQYVRAKARC